MELRKNGESVNRVFGESGEIKERLDMVQYEVTDGESITGTVNVYAGHAVINLSVGNLGSIENGVEVVRLMLDNMVR